jgi:hypothetical protein
MRTIHLALPDWLSREIEAVAYATGVKQTWLRDLIVRELHEHVVTEYKGNVLAVYIDSIPDGLVRDGQQTLGAAETVNEIDDLRDPDPEDLGDVFGETVEGTAHPI